MVLVVSLISGWIDSCHPVGVSLVATQANSLIRGTISNELQLINHQVIITVLWFGTIELCLFFLYPVSPVIPPPLFNAGYVQ